MDSELVVNLWAIYDVGSGFVYALAGRAYRLAGAEDEKFAVLRHLSATDYLTARRHNVPERFQVLYDDGTSRKGVAPLHLVRDSDFVLFQELFSTLEEELPLLPDFSGDEPRTLGQKLPDAPLCLVTIVYEDDSGNTRPIVTDEDKLWAHEVEASLGRRLPA